MQRKSSKKKGWWSNKELNDGCTMEFQQLFVFEDVFWFQQLLAFENVFLIQIYFE